MEKSQKISWHKKQKLKRQYYNAAAEIINRESLKKINSGIYLLEIAAKSEFKIGIKKFSQITLPAGFYYYTGSAQKNLINRIERHIRSKKVIHWHIDHLTTNKSCSIKSILLFPDRDKNFECDLISILLKDFDFKINLAGFGNSDCDRCESHLLFSKRKINYNHFISRYHAIALSIPLSSATF
ncbi:MAG: GIY-YIG nuclease family protein [bacterium]